MMEMALYDQYQDIPNAMCNAYVEYFVPDEHATAARDKVRDHWRNTLTRTQAFERLFAYAQTEVAAFLSTRRATAEV